MEIKDTINKPQLICFLKSMELQKKILPISLKGQGFKASYTFRNEVLVEFKDAMVQLKGLFQNTLIEEEEPSTVEKLPPFL